MRQIWQHGRMVGGSLGGVDRAQQSINKSSLDVSNVSPWTTVWLQSPVLTCFDLFNNHERFIDTLLCLTLL